MIHLVDDQLLSAMLRDTALPEGPTNVFTTGYWYVRLCQAVLGAAERTGVLSGPFAALPPETRHVAMRSLIQLPESVGLVSLRELGPLIGALRRRHDLNILGMEVLAAAIHLEAEVQLSAPSPRLQEALLAEGRDVTLVS